MSVEYSPGGWVVLAGARRWLFAQVAPTEPLVALCWPLVERGAPLDEILGVIAHEGLRAVGSFAAVSRQDDGGVRVIVRGAASVEVTPLDGAAADVRAVDVATWLDQLFDTSVGTVVIRGDEPPDPARLPLVCGAALASGVWIGSSTPSTLSEPPAFVASVPAASAPVATSARPVPVGGPVPGPAARVTPTVPTPASGPEPVPQPELVPPPGHMRQPEDAQPEPVPPRRQPVDTSHRLQQMLRPNPIAPTEPAPEPVAAPPVVEPPVQPPPTRHGRRPEPEPEPARPTFSAGDGMIGEVPWLPPAPPTPGRPPAWAAPTGGTGRHQLAAPPPDEPAHTRITPRTSTGAQTVSAVLCPRTHPNPPGALTCRDCGDAVPASQQPRDVPRPVLGVLRPLAGGEPIVLERDVVLGREPTASFAPGGPNVIKVRSPNREVSGTHLAVGLDGWTVTVEDLASSNGTTVSNAGAVGAVRVLRPHEPVAIEPGAVVTLGGEVALRYEVGRGHDGGRDHEAGRG